MVVESAQPSHPSVDPRNLRDACGQFATGTNVITTHCDGRDHGMTANAFMSVSLNPPLIAISIAAKAKMLPKIQKSGRFAVSVLALGMEDLAWHFAGKPKAGAIDCFELSAGLSIISGSVAHFVTDVVDEVLAGDHAIFIGRVREMKHDPAKEPLVFFRGRFGALADQRAAPHIASNYDDELIVSW